MSNNFEIKICGINDKLCMDAAIESKADYIGLVFYDKSPRNLSLGDAQQLLKNRNRHSKIVALTVNSDDDFIKEIKQNIKPDYFQFHGNETPLRCKEIKVKFEIPIIKGIGIKNKLDLIKANQDYENLCDILLLDSPSTILPGGNGEMFNWNIIKNCEPQKKWMLAGGLNINNIEQAVKISNPPAIDISSGVEISKGIKDPEMIKNFITKCRNI
ncbi:phosphoribosylanthranilate isomerase [Candidatus Levibacter sp. Uisw_134_01]|uniref:phosphoribosylanthranilate isomerase n=1 Tax=Candidatus Levibacter sp. Uisw_134_01 TaxID=3230999 RepID=UPI003D5491A2